MSKGMQASVFRTVILAGGALVLFSGCRKSTSVEHGKTDPKRVADEKQSTEARSAGGARARWTAGDSAASQTPAQTHRELALRLVIKKTVYRAGEPLEARVFLDNKGRRAQLVLRRASHVDVGFDARNKAGKFITELLPPVPPRPPTAQDFVTLKPGASVELKNWELLHRVNRQITAGNGRKGVFVVSASYHVWPKKVAAVKGLAGTPWTGKLQSNRITVTYR